MRAGQNELARAGCPAGALTPMIILQREQCPSVLAVHQLLPGDCRAINNQSSEQSPGESIRLHPETPGLLSRTPLTSMTATEWGSMHVRHSGHPQWGLGHPPPAWTLTPCVNGSLLFRHRCWDLKYAQASTKRGPQPWGRPASHGTSRLRRKDVEGTGRSSLPSDVKSPLSCWWTQGGDTFRLEREPPA